MATCSGYKHSTPIDEKAPVPLSARGAYNHRNRPYQTIWCASFIHSLTPGVSGQVALAALVALIALVIYHLTIHTRYPPHSSPLESSARFYTETVRPGSHPGHGTNCGRKDKWRHYICDICCIYGLRPYGDVGASFSVTLRCVTCALSWRRMNIKRETLAATSGPRVFQERSW